MEILGAIFTVGVIGMAGFMFDMRSEQFDYYTQKSKVKDMQEDILMALEAADGNYQKNWTSLSSVQANQCDRVKAELIAKSLFGDTANCGVNSMDKYQGCEEGFYQPSSSVIDGIEYGLVMCCLKSIPCARALESNSRSRFPAVVRVYDVATQAPPNRAQTVTTAPRPCFASCIVQWAPIARITRR